MQSFKWGGSDCLYEVLGLIAVILHRKLTGLSGLIEHSAFDREVVDLIPNQDIPKTLKLIPTSGSIASVSRGYNTAVRQHYKWPSVPIVTSRHH